ncbi:MAG: ABC transporter substrate-binding protein [Clostridia bacterium]|nr:ABC transporter substrate-binding protein [Clostridia bacterium]MCI1998829.1 ABC transporter substrate-binding protein [Clostridia bacterium]MCI2013579.1 ABC transporter substrate-binding protein [Clostridia bacterium]
MKKRILGFIVCSFFAVSALAGCGSSSTASSNVKSSASSVSSAKASSSESSSANSSSSKASSSESSASDTGDFKLKKGNYVIGLSNAYFGNTWRKQMVDCFTNAAEKAKTDGYIKDYEIQNGDGTVNSQIAQINSFILEGVDAIVIDSASETALNSSIQQALDAGITVVSFDSVVNLDGVYKMDYPWADIGKASVDFMAKKYDGKGKYIVVRGVSGAAPDQGIYSGITEELKKYPDMNIEAQVIGQASATVTQQELLKILDSYPDVDGVITHCGGDAIGVVNAFDQLNRKMPTIIGDNTGEFIQWWLKQDGYETLSQGSTPGCGGAAFWVALDILNGYDVPQSMMLSIPRVTTDNLQDYKDLKAGEFISPDFTNEYVIKNIIDAAKSK